MSVALVFDPVTTYGQSVCTKTWTLEETRRVGSATGDVAFSGILALEIGPDGLLYITDALTPYVTVLTPSGQLDRTLGRAGRGPGEFEIVALSAGWKGDTLWVEDLYKTQFFSPDDEVYYQVQFRSAVPSEGSVFIAGRPLADGSFLGRRRVNGFHVLMRDNPYLPLRRFSPNGEIIATIAVNDVRGRAIAYGTAPSGRINYHAHPLMDDLPGGLSEHLVALVPDGSAIFKIGKIASEPEDTSFEILKISIRGDTLLQQVVPYEPRPVTERQHDRLREEFAGWIAGDYLPPASRPTSPSVAERQRELARQAYWSPTYHPPVRQIIAGHDGTIWLLREMRTDRVDIWEVYSEEGQLLGRLEIAEGRGNALPWAPHMIPLWVTTEQIWATTIDELDVPYLHHFRVLPDC